MYRVGLGIIIALLLLVGAFFGLNGVSFAVDGIIPGVHVGPLDLGGLTRGDAESKLNELAVSIESLPVQMVYGANTCQLPAGELGYSLDVDKSLRQAEQVGNSGSIFTRLAERQRVKLQGLHIKPDLLQDRQQLEIKVAQAWPNIIVEPENAGFKVLQDDRVIIVPGRMGTKIDFAALEKDITEQITANRAELLEVTLPVIDVAPLRTTQDIESMEINGLIAQYSTRFDAGQADRTYNIRVAAAALDGLLIAPGEEFSFNRVVGPRSSEAGYKSANVIVNNELVPGLGGGVCQVSSTLYNAVLLANLKIVERNNHSLPVSYVPIGRDATVVYGAVDFKFANNADFYIYAKSIVSGNNLTVKLYGNTEKTPQVELSSWVTAKIEPTVVYEKDPNLAEGEKVVKQGGKNGFKAAAVRYVWKDGEKVEEKLTPSLYHPVRRIIAIGTGATSPAVIVPLDEDLKPPATAQPLPTEPESPPAIEEDQVLQPVNDEQSEIDPDFQPPDGEQEENEPDSEPVDGEEDENIDEDDEVPDQDSQLPDSEPLS
ncbi:MAG TPA: vanomycin resistance protein VanB [Desulfotomaculum sp.]|nr:vanomycin resistance protein VanB [Desulfotomaculum sp.]